VKRIHRGVGLLQRLFNAPVHLVRSPQLCLLVAYLALEGLSPLLVSL
jgi:hypothetical protein